MPLPKTTNVGKIIKELNKSSTKRPRKQKVAIALDTARKAGAKIPKKRKSRNEHLAERMTS